MRYRGITINHMGMNHTEHCDNLRELIAQKIAGHKIIAGVVGLGYVGLPLAVEMAKAGFRTIGFDVNKKKVDSINHGINYILDVDDSDLKMTVEKGMLNATSDFNEISNVDFVAVCVPTPLDDQRQPDMRYVESSARSIAEYLHKGMIISLESTIYPGATEELIKPILEASGLKCGRDFFLGFSPERVDPGHPTRKTSNIPKVVGAIGDDACELIAAMYESVLHVDMHRTSSPAVAEVAKLLENCYRNVNIGLINEFAIFCNKIGVDIWEVVDAAKTKPFGFSPFYPGAGPGGHCIPVDPYYLNHKAKSYGLRFSTIEASLNVNESMPEYCVLRIGEMLNRHYNKPLCQSRILVLGLAYKHNIDDCRESPATNIVEKLHAQGADVVFHDPYVARFSLHGKEYVGEAQLSADLIRSADIVVIIPPHSNVDYQFVQQNAKVIFDISNVTRDLPDRSNIERL